MSAAAPQQVSSLLERAAGLSFLQGLLDGVRASTQGRLVLVAGEAGVGKTLLLRGFCEAQPAARILWGACEPLGTPRPLGPLLDTCAHSREPRRSDGARARGSGTPLRGCRKRRAGAPPRGVRAHRGPPRLGGPAQAWRAESWAGGGRGSPPRSGPRRSGRGARFRRALSDRRTSPSERECRASGADERHPRRRAGVVPSRHRAAAPVRHGHERSDRRPRVAS